MQLVHIFPTKNKIYEIFYYNDRGLDDHVVKINSKVVWTGFGCSNAMLEVIRLMALEIDGEPDEK